MYNLKIEIDKELNYLLLKETKNISNKYNIVNIIGDITDFKKWRRSGCGFKLTQDKELIECKVWEKDGIMTDIEKYKYQMRCNRNNRSLLLL